MQCLPRGRRIAFAIVALALCATACGAPQEGETTSNDRAAPATGALPTAGAPDVGRAAVELIVAHEGLELEAYQGPSGKWFIGYGHSIGASPGMTITAERAEELLSEDLRIVADKVRELVRVPLSQNELGALVSLTYSIGEGNFASSTVLEKLNEDDRAGAAEAFSSWVMIDGEVNERLETRRAQERDLFVTPSS